MADAVIVSTARTPIGKAYRGTFNMTHRRSWRPCRQECGQARRVIPGEVEDVILGCALPERATGQNIARQAAIRAGLPVTVSGMTVNRFCSSACRQSRLRRSASCPAKGRSLPQRSRKHPPGAGRQEHAGRRRMDRGA